MQRLFFSRGGKSSAWVTGFILAWSAGVAGGMGTLWRHASTPGVSAHSQSAWPLGDMLPRSTGLATLVMTVHPQCPCSRASVHELEVLSAKCDGKLQAFVLLAEPAGSGQSASSTPLWEAIAGIPGVVAIDDKDGALAKRLGAETSGQVFLYDAQGQLKFSGGITAARGHEGDSDGLAAIKAIVHSQSPAVIRTPVYGCSIW